MSERLEAIEERWMLIDGVDGHPLPRLPVLVGLNTALGADQQYQATMRLPLAPASLVWIAGQGPTLDAAVQDLVKNAKARVAAERKRLRSKLN